MTRLLSSLLAVAVLGTGVACRDKTPGGPSRASGYVEATDVRVSAEVGGRVVELLAEEGKRIKAGDVLARIDTADAEIALRRAKAERDQAVAQLKLLQAGPRPEDVRQARAQVESAEADVAAAAAELKSAEADLQRFEALLQANAGSRKQRDDAATRRQVASARVNSARERARASSESLTRVRSGARAEEVAAARARVAAVDAQIEALQKSVTDATYLAGKWRRHVEARRRR
jgi:multidrug resistance efflux pump